MNADSRRFYGCGFKEVLWTLVYGGFMDVNSNVAHGMDDSVLKGEIARRIDELERKSLQIDGFLADVPAGSVEVNLRGGNYYYRQVICDRGSSMGAERGSGFSAERGGGFSAERGSGFSAERKAGKIYLSTDVPEQKVVIEQLINKGMCKKLKPAVEAELKVLRAFYKGFCPEKKYLPFENLPPGKKIYARKLFHSPDEIKKNMIEAEAAKRQNQLAFWNKKYAEYQNPYRKDELSIETSDGHFVRSKSERMIADELARNGYSYKYEISFGANIGTIYPDFLIFDHHTGGVYIWEHFGMMDNPRYLNRECLSKIDAYSAEGFVLGRNLLATFETSERPLQISQVRKIISMIGK